MASLWDMLGSSVGEVEGEEVPHFQANHHRTHSHNLHTTRSKHASSPSPKTSMTPNMADKLMDRLVSTALPTAVNQEQLDQRLQRQSNRPPFSVQLTSRNFRKFTARTGVVFETYYFVLELLCWKHPALTLSILSMYSFICLNPELLLVLPPGYLLFAVMVPAYMSRHPPEPSTLASLPVPASGPPLKESDKPRPVPEMSREFYLNVVDTQNSMYDYVLAYDTVTQYITELGYFDGDESRSSMVLLFLVSLLALLMVFGKAIMRVVPWRLLFLVLGWGILAFTYSSEFTTNEQFEQLESRAKNYYTNMLGRLDSAARHEFEMIEAHEQRQVEIFELQHNVDSDVGQWSPSVFVTDPYTLHACRNDFTPPTGPSYIQDVLAPKQWTFLTDHWQLDFNPDDWIYSRGLVSSTDIDAGEKWVYDKVDSHRSMTWRRRRWVRICSRC